MISISTWIFWCFVLKRSLLSIIQNIVYSTSLSSLNIKNQQVLFVEWFPNRNDLSDTASVWNMYWVRSTCGSKWEKPTTDNGKFTMEHRARSRMGNRHRSTKLLRWTIQQKQQSVQSYLLVLSINAFDRNNQ